MATEAGGPDIKTQVKRALTQWDTATISFNSTKAVFDKIVQPKRLPYLEELCRKIDPISSSRTSTSKSKETTSFCRPWNHQDFLHRVATFRIGQWFAKPQIIGPYECARAGWINTGSDMIQCQCCEKQLCFYLDDKLGMEGTRESALAFAQKLNTGHEEYCAWTDNPSPVSFTTIPYQTHDQTYYSIVRRVKRLLECAQLPEIAASFLEQLNQDWISSVKTQLIDHDSILGTSIDGTGLEDLTTCIAIALCGWECKANDYLECELCNRTIGLWNFKLLRDSRPCVNSKRRITRSMEAADPSPKRAVEPFDPISQHRWYCAWRTESGWERCVNVMKEKLKEHSKKRKLNSDEAMNPTEAFHTVRKWLDLS